MRKVLVVVTACFSMAASAAGWEAGKGVSNDRATGANAHDVTFVARNSANGYGYRQYDLPIGFTFLPWAAPNFESSVYGVRLNLGWGRYDRTMGIDAGAFSHSRKFGGIAANFCGNWSDGDAAGLQVGFVNAGATVYGLQIGAVNVADRLCGVQIGFLNFNSAGIVLPVINAGW